MSTLKRNITRIAIATAAILSVPLIAMLFTNEVDWSLGDFIVMGILLFGSGVAFELIARQGNNLAYRAAVGVAVGAGLLMTWVNLAVGLIGSGANPANVMVVAVYFVGVIGAVASRLEANGMARTMFAMAAVQMLIPVATAIFWNELTQEPPGVFGVFALNGFFAVFFIVSGILFQHSQPKLNPSPR